MGNSNDDFQRESQKIYDEIFSDDRPKQKTLYHYTGLEALKGILESREMWFTEISNLNDPQELIFGIKYMLKVIEKFCKKSESIDTLLCNLNHFLDLQEKDKLMSFYICSFCKKPDYLPAWRYYGNNGQGVAIGFDEKFWRQTNEKSSSKNCDFFVKASYGTHPYRHSSIAKRCSKFINDLSILLDGVENEKQSLLAHTVLNCLRIKHADFKTEHEYRLVINELEEYPKKLSDKPYTRLNHDKNPKTITSIYPEIFIDGSKKIKVRRVAKKFDENNISEIYLGPQHNQNYEKIKRELERLLEEHNYKNVKILKSSRSFSG